MKRFSENSRVFINPMEEHRAAGRRMEEWERRQREKLAAIVEYSKARSAELRSRFPNIFGVDRRSVGTVVREDDWA